MDRKFFGISFIKTLKFIKNLSPCLFFKQYSSNFQEMFFVLKEKKTLLMNLSNLKIYKFYHNKLNKKVFFFTKNKKIYKIF